MKLTPRDVSWDVGTFFLPLLPHSLIESQCPRCGGKAVAHERAHNTVMNIGNSHQPTKLYFYCYNQYPTPSQDCDTEWTEEVIFRLAIETREKHAKESD